MDINRRNFIRTSFGSAALATLAACTHDNAKGCEEDDCCKNAQLNLSLQEGITPGNSLEEKLDFLENLGVVGLEVSGSVSGGGFLGQRVEEFKRALSGRTIKISAICSGFNGFILSETESVRQECIDTMHLIIEAAGALDSVGVIIVPAFSNQVPAKPHTQETRDFLCEQFKAMGEFALKHNTTVILEPLNRRETFYLRQVGDAASICRDIDCEGVKCMGDFWHMTWEEVCDMAAFISAGKQYLQHVHIASRKNRLIPGLDGEADNYIDGFKGLKMIGYDKYVSFECGYNGNDRVGAVTTAVRLLREQWEKA
jgi:sugar phosphate isomerase/epimerase